MPFDYKHDSTDDLAIENGDFVVIDSTKQHQSLLIRLKKGELRQYPKTGVGVDEFLLNESPGDVDLEIRRQFEADGQVVRGTDVRFDDQQKLVITIDAYYK